MVYQKIISVQALNHLLGPLPSLGGQFLTLLLSIQNLTIDLSFEVRCEGHNHSKVVVMLEYCLPLIVAYKRDVA